MKLVSYHVRQNCTAHPYSTVKPILIDLSLWEATCLERPDSWEKVLHFNVILTCHQRPPVLRDHILGPIGWCFKTGSIVSHVLLIYSHSPHPPPKHRIVLHDFSKGAASLLQNIPCCVSYLILWTWWIVARLKVRLTFLKSYFITHSTVLWMHVVFPLIKGYLSNKNRCLAEGVSLLEGDYCMSLNRHGSGKTSGCRDCWQA